MKELHFDAPVDEPIGLDGLAVPAGHEVELDIRLESVTEGVLVSGTVYADAVGECARCLTEVTQPVEANLRELYAYPGSATDETTDTDELPRVIDDLIDLLPLVRDEITLALPLVPLCRPDCQGLCPECGERFADLEQGHSHEILDPRWAALAEKFGSASSSDAASSPESAGNSQQETPKEK
jgi:uncharacterized protein